MPQDVSSVIGKSLKTSSRPLELGVVGVVGVVGGVDGTLNSFRLSGPFFSWLLVLFFILVDGRVDYLANNATLQLRDRSDLNR